MRHLAGTFAAVITLLAPACSPYVEPDPQADATPADATCPAGCEAAMP